MANASLLFCVLSVWLLVMPMDCRLFDQPTAANKQQQKKLPLFQRELGWSSGFTMPSFTMPSFTIPSFPSFSNPFPYKAPTTDAKSSLTGLPWVLSWQDQIAGGLPVAQWPPRNSQSTPASSQTSQQTTPASQPAPAPAPGPQPTPAPAKQEPAPAQAQPEPAPAPAAAPPEPQAIQQPAPTSGCSSTDTSASAVFGCVNAMRTDPRAYIGAYKCDYAAWISAATNPQRKPLGADTRLGRSSARMAQDMAATGTVSHVGSDGSSMQQRITAEGFNTYPQAENVAGGQGSAMEVAAGWMCSDGHRTNLLSCDLDVVGTATAYAAGTNRPYYVQDFGCSATHQCHSCY